MSFSVCVCVVLVFTGSQCCKQSLVRPSPKSQFLNPRVLNSLSFSLFLSREWGEWIPMIVHKVPYSSPNNPFPHSLLSTSQPCSGGQEREPQGHLRHRRATTGPCTRPGHLRKGFLLELYSVKQRGLNN